MDNSFLKNLGEVTAGRIASNKVQILRSIDCKRKGLPVLAEDQEDRQRAALQRNFQLSPELAGMMQENITKEEIETRAFGPEAIQGPTADFVPVSYLERGLDVSKAVSRITSIHGEAIGTGFLASSNLLVTNHHVIPSKIHAASYLAQFDFEKKLDGSDKPVTSFYLDPEQFFFTDDIDGLDVTVVAIGERMVGERPIENFGWCGLSDSGTKHALGDYVTIIQHPAGRHKEVVLRENMIAGRHEVALHYVADTEGGSSGSPVFSPEWKVVALHHWAGGHIWSGEDTYQRTKINEGIRISRIVKKLREAGSGFNVTETTFLNELLRNGVEGFSSAYAGHSINRTESARSSSHDIGNAASARINEAGGITWTIPLEVSVNLPGHLNGVAPVPSPRRSQQPRAARAGLESAALTKPGYRPDFIDGFILPLPQFTSAQKNQIARIKPGKVQPGGNDWELRYQHFSIVMNSERRLCFYTAVNIHGESLIGYSREKGTFYDYDAASTAFAESLSGLEGAEADKWSVDDRIDLDEQTIEQFYKSTPNHLIDANGHEDLQKTPNFDRGHLVKRLDPCWGDKMSALSAERDTFHWTNAAPQASAFNQGKATRKLGKTEGRLWQGIENYILRNAWAQDTKVTVFTGPVFDQNDPVYSDKTKSLKIQVPLKFWKVIVWSENGNLKSLAMIADQSKILQEKKDGQEKFLEDHQLALMVSFVSTVAKVEKLAGFEFGDVISKADVRFGKRDRQDVEDDGID